jgi:hypothetical protein
VTFWIGDIPVGAGTTGVARPDLVTSPRTARLGTAGFSCPVDLSPALGAASEIALRTSVSDGDGLIRGWLEPVPLSYSGASPTARATGQIDHWKSGDRVERGVLRVYGWVVVPGADAAAVAISVNGRVVKVAAVDVARPEVARVVEDVDSLDAGFDTEVDLSGVEGDEVLIEVSAIPADYAHASMSPDARMLPPLALRLPEVG